MLEITADRQDIGKIRNRGAGVEVVQIQEELDAG